MLSSKRPVDKNDSAACRLGRSSLQKSHLDSRYFGGNGNYSEDQSLRNQLESSEMSGQSQFLESMSPSLSPPMTILEEPLDCTSYDHFSSEDESLNRNIYGGVDQSLSGQAPYVTSAYKYNMIYGQFSAEQKKIQKELVVAFQHQDVQLAVSTLRKVYTKQFREFRIPIVLTAAMPSITDPSTHFSEYSCSLVVFTLDCVQWSIGAQKNSNADSFKYKMNKKISCWLLRIQKEKGMPSVYIASIGAVALSLVHYLLNHVMELELCLDILMMTLIHNPMDVLLPYVHAWSNCGDVMLASKACEFASKHGFPISFHRQQYGSFTRNDGAVSFNITSGAGMENMSYVSSGYSSLSVGGVSLAQAHTFDTEVSQRLLTLLRSFPDGILGSRVPIYYRERFGEPLRLPGHKLRDIMISLRVVEVGEEGPGDKIYRIPHFQLK